MQDWHPFELMPQVFSIAITVAIIAAIFVTYYIKLKKVPINESPRGFCLGIQLYIQFLRNMVIESLGKKAEKITPYFIYLFSYLIISNLIGIIGLENPTSSLTVTLSLGLVTFFGTFVVGFRYQRLSYLNKFFYTVKLKNKKSIPIMFNPMSIPETIAPLISLSFRLWGNIFAGGIIVTLWYYMMGIIQKNIPVIGVFNILGGITVPPINAYFDLLCGLIQALVFVLLTNVYWSLAKHTE